MPTFQREEYGGKGLSTRGDKRFSRSQKRMEKKASQVKANGEAEGKTNTAPNAPQEELRPPRATRNVGGGDEKGVKDDSTPLPNAKESEKKPEETGENMTLPPLDSQEDDLKLSFVPNSMEELKEGEPMSQDPNPVCCPPLQQ